MERKSIGSFIAVLRKAKGLTQRELADKLGVSDKAVSRWERDETAPDLYLIPSIAEIFGVTADELLRGERAGESSSTSEKQSEKTERQIKTVLKGVRTKFLTKTLICTLIAVVGLLAAMLCNFAFYRAELGFYIGLIFFVTAAIIEIIFAVLAVSSLDAEEFDGEHLTETRKYIIKKTESIVFISFILLAYCIPLIIEAGSTSFINIRVDFFGWLVFGSIFAALAGIVCAISDLILDKIMQNRGSYTIDETTLKKRHLAKIRFASPLLPVVKIFAPLLAITIIANIACLNIFDYDFFLRGKGVVWTDSNEFIEFMETRTSENGETIDNSYTVYPTYILWIDGTKISFSWNNRKVGDFNINGVRAKDIERGQSGIIITQIYQDGEKVPDSTKKEVYDIPNFHAVTYFQEEMFNAKDWTYDIAMYFTWAYVAEALAFAVIYTVLVVRKFKETRDE